MAFNATHLARENVKKMAPYSTARHEFTGEATIFLDANENAFGSPVNLSAAENGERANLNRYPDPLQIKVKEKIGKIKGIPVNNIFLGNGSDEAIDLLMRIFCVPGKDNIIILPPTYGMYEVCAAMNDVAVKRVPLTKEFQPDLDGIAEAIDAFTKLIFVCSPNNPTGNSMERAAIEVILNNFEGLVVIDEAYINYAKQKTFIPELVEYPNLVILQTLSKAWGLAGLRLGMAFAGKPVIDLFNKIKYPYNISIAAQEIALQALDNISQVNDWTKTTVIQREWLGNELRSFSFTQSIYNSDANFLLVKMKNARGIYEWLSGLGIIVRDRSKVILCDECLRITVGTPEENQQLLKALTEYQNQVN
jgi:histidinol-phosphate aminotransferase